MFHSEPFFYLSKYSSKLQIICILVLLFPSKSIEGSTFSPALDCTDERFEKPPPIIDLERYEGNSVVVTTSRWNEEGSDGWNKMHCAWRFRVQEGAAVRVQALEYTRVWKSFLLYLL